MSDTIASGGGAPAGGPASADRNRELNASSLIKAIHAHRRLARDTPGYWDHYCSLIKILCRASAIVLVRKMEGGSWVPLGVECSPTDWLSQAWSEPILEHGDRSLQNGFAFIPMQDDAQRLHILTMVRANGIGDSLLVMDIPERERAQLNELILRALLANDFTEPDARTDPALKPMPANEPGPAGKSEAISEASRAPEQRIDEGMLALLDLAAQVMNEERFNAAVLVLANGLAAHYRAEQAVLGWREGDGMRVAAISHLDRFERNTDNIRLLEEIFYEAQGQESEVWYPERGSGTQGASSHEEFMRALGFAQQCAVPIRDGTGMTSAVIFLGFPKADGERPAMGNLQIAMDLLYPWLLFLKNRDRWWGARLAASIRPRIERLLGPGPVWGRAFALLGSALLLFILFGNWDYRIEATSQLTTDSVRMISAQFDGRVEEVLVTAGDVVKEGDLLATLDTRELRQQEMDMRADRQRQGAEADKARAAGNLAELEIAQARYAQAEARLNRVLQYLAQSRFIAPFNGVIVDGERKDLLNAPVKKGDKLFRLARVDGLYVELLVPEREIRYVPPDATGELRLLSRPDQKIPFKVSVFIPMAQVKGQEGNHFLMKAQVQQMPEDWWRTGMSGIALIDGGKKNIAWILTHRLIDTLKLKLWWLW